MTKPLDRVPRPDYPSATFWLNDGTRVSGEIVAWGKRDTIIIRRLFTVVPKIVWLPEVSKVKLSQQ